jgi:hypothetical protein
MNEMMQSISFDLMSRNVTTGSHNELRPARPVRGTRVAFRERLRAFLTRTTLGPVARDQVLGNDRWWSRAVSRAD